MESTRGWGEKKEQSRIGGQNEAGRVQPGPLDRDSF